MKKKENKKQGFAITGVLYSILLLFVVMLIGILNNLEGRKQLLDVMKEDTIKASESDEAIKDLYEQVSQLKKQVTENQIIIENLKTKDSNKGKELYPVGSIYITTKKTNPSEYIGGTWIEWGKGRVPVGVDTSQGEFNTVEKTGGEKTHTLTINEMPSHTHIQNVHNHFIPTFDVANPNYVFSFNDQGGDFIASTDNAAPGIENGVRRANRYSTNGAIAINQNTGGNQSHNNLQPYITAYMWKRTV